MAYSSEAERIADTIETARANVAEATARYRKGGSAEAVNNANRALADAQDQRYELNSGRDPRA